MVDVSELRSIINQIRRVKYGDYVMSDDHNLQTDALKKVADILETVGKYSLKAFTNYTESKTEVPNSNRGDYIYEPNYYELEIGVTNLPYTNVPLQHGDLLVMVIKHVFGIDSSGTGSGLFKSYIYSCFLFDKYTEAGWSHYDYSEFLDSDEYYLEATSKLVPKSRVWASHHIIPISTDIIKLLFADQLRYSFSYPSGVTVTRINFVSDVYIYLLR